MDMVNAVPDRTAGESSPLNEAELTTFLNMLLEAERAGAKVVSAYLDDVALSSDMRARLLGIQRDESRNSAVLIRMLRHIRAEPTQATGQFLQTALATHGIRARLDLLNRGQGWVARRIAAVLPFIADRVVRDEMKSMQDSHLANIDVCRRILDELDGPSLGPL